MPSEIAKGPHGPPSGCKVVDLISSRLRLGETNGWTSHPVGRGPLFSILAWLVRFFPLLLPLPPLHLFLPPDVILVRTCFAGEEGTRKFMEVDGAGAATTRQHQSYCLGPSYTRPVEVITNSHQTPRQGPSSASSVSFPPSPATDTLGCHAAATQVGGPPVRLAGSTQASSHESALSIGGRSASPSGYCAKTGTLHNTISYSDILPT